MNSGSTTSLRLRSEEHTSESSHLGISYAVFCLKKKIDLICIYSVLTLNQYIALRGCLFSLATPGFAAIGGYAGAFLLKQTAMGPILAAAAATASGAVAGLFLSVPLAKLRGAFQAIATIGFVQIMVSLALYAQPVTGGALGLNAIPKVATTGTVLATLIV